MTIVRLAMASLHLRVKSWLFSQRLAKAERRHASTQIIASHAGRNWNIGMMAQLGRLNNNKHTHKDWKK